MQGGLGSVLDIYTATIPDREMDISSIYPIERQKEIESCKDKKVRAEKFCAWQLLSFALFSTFGYDIKDLDIKKDKQGKWTASNCFFSISHSSGVVAVALSNSAVGVDIEAVKEEKQAVIERVLTDAERKELLGVEADKKALWLTQKWTEKESFFKANQLKNFCPSKIEAERENISSKQMVVGDKAFVLTVYSKQIDKINYKQITL